MKYIKTKLSIFAIGMNISLSPNVEQLNEWNISFNNALAENRNIEHVQVVGSADNLRVEGGFTFGAGTSFEGGTGSNYGGASGGSRSNDNDDDNDDAEKADLGFEEASDIIVNMKALRDAITSTLISNELNGNTLNKAQKEVLGTLLGKVDRVIGSTNTYLGTFSSTSQLANHIAKGEAIEAISEVVGYLVSLGATATAAALTSGVIVPVAAGALAGYLAEPAAERLIREVIIPMNEQIKRDAQEVPSPSRLYCSIQIRRQGFCNEMDDR